ncbi:MAG: TolC family protein [Burkholderiaceae bacterium]|jgi:cobalt-zinc-cadmium efflux system outer membrane protein|nr:TolC family protein [Burkholderiaceae bacterium]
MKSGTLWCASLLWLCVAARAETLTMQQALMAARDNVEVAIARGGLAAARADIQAANHAPLPVLSGKFSQIDLQNGVGPGGLIGSKRIDKSVGIDWTWERGGKRALRTQAAERLAEAAQADLDEVVRQQLLAAQAAFLDLLAAQERLAQVEALAQDGKQLAVTAAQRVKAGDLPTQDASRIEIETERAIADAQAAALERQQAALALAQLMGRPDVRDALVAEGGWPSPQLAPAGGLDALAQARPDVRAADLRVQAARSAVDGARALRKGDVTWGMSYDHYPGTSRALVELRAQMPLQWGYAYEGEIGRALAELQQAEDTLDKVLRAAGIELQRMQAEAAAMSARAQRYEAEILPRARRVAQAAEQAYRRGAIALTDLLDARRTLRATLLEAIAAQLDAAKAIGAWNLRVQPDIVSISSKGQP